MANVCVHSKRSVFGYSCELDQHLRVCFGCIADAIAGIPDFCLMREKFITEQNEKYVNQLIQKWEIDE